MRPTECPDCWEMIEPTDLKCNYCGTIIKTDPNKVWQTIQLPNGNDLTIYNDSTIYIQFPDRRKVEIYGDGTTGVDFPDGREARIYDDGTTGVDFPNGREEWIDNEGTRSEILHCDYEG